MRHKLFLYLTFVAVCLCLICPPVSAVKKHTLNLSDKLPYKMLKTNYDDISRDFFVNFNSYVRGSVQDKYLSLDFAKNVISNDGQWFYSWYIEEGSGSKIPTLFFAKSSTSCKIRLYSSSTGETLSLSASGCDYVAFVGDFTMMNIYSPEKGYSDFSVPVLSEKNKGYITLFNVDNYEVEPGLELVGVLPKSNAEQLKQPFFNYGVKDKKLEAFYLFNLTDLEVEAFNLKWRLFRTDNQYNNPVEIESMTAHLAKRFERDNLEVGFYRLEIEFLIKPPNAPPPNLVWKSLIRFFYDGNDFNYIVESGDSTRPPISCDDIKDFTARFNCVMTSRFNFGLVNPTLNAFRSLVSAFFVQKPSCQLSGIPDNRYFKSSDFEAAICNSSKPVFDLLPEVKVIINMSLGLAAGFIVVRLIEDVLNPSEVSDV